MRTLLALGCGLLFGAGLAVSDMINPARVLGFLDVGGGAWDPTLAFVMAGALVPMAVAWRLARAPRRPSHAEAFPAPANRVLDRRLAIGAAVFGLGWGLIGLCPGPALAGLAVGGPSVWIFVAAMVAGFAAAGFIAKVKS
ncbi:MAG: YeeE/YedE family protein [Rhodospirillales bacterium]